MKQILKEFRVVLIGSLISFVIVFIWQMNKILSKVKIWLRNDDVQSFITLGVVFVLWLIMIYYSWDYLAL